MSSADDATLLNQVRAGDAAAFGTLYQRHEDAARRLAWTLVGTAAEVDDVVSETFARVLDVTLRGGGPTDAFRPYLLTALRRVCYDRLRGQRAHVPTEEQDLPDPGEPFIDPAVASLDKSLIVRAFLSLPERWIAVLWHTEIEEASPAEVGPLLGLNRNGVAQLKRRAREGLRQAYLQMHISSIPRQECRPTAERLGAFVRNSLSGRDSLAVSEHLRECADCSAAYAELADVNLALRGVVAPVFLGGAAAAYLSAHAAVAGAAGAANAAAAAASSSTAAAGASAGTAHAGSAGASATGPGASAGTAGAASSSAGANAAGASGGSGWLRSATHARTVARLRHASLPLRVLVAGAAATLAVAAVAIAVTLSGHHLPAGRAAQHRVQAGSTPAPVATGTQPASGRQRSHTPRIVPAATQQAGGGPAGPTPAPTPDAPSSASSSPGTSPTPAPTRRPTPTPTPTPTPAPSAAVVLAASINVYGTHRGWGAQVVFTVSNTGTAASADVTASITLPAGTWMMGQGQGGPGGGNGDGWSCQPTESGASCQDSSITAGSQSTGVIFIGVGSPAACGQPVDMTATSGSASASAQSSNDIQC